MRISRMRIGNFANFLDLDVEIEASIVIVGENKVSKSGLTPSETFRVLKKKKIRQHGEYRTRRFVLAAWDRMEASGGFKAMGM